MKSPDPKPFRAVWSRRWFRRTTYTLVTGSLVVGTASWFMQRPFVTRWASQTLGEVIRKETGLDFQEEGLEIYLFKGRIVVNSPRLGGDLFSAKRLEGTIDLGALLVGDLHIRNLDLDGPQIHLNGANLRQIHLREHPPSKSPLLWQVDRVSVRDGLLTVRDPAWGVPAFQTTFSAHGQGQGPQRLHLFLDMLRMEAGEGPAALTGRLALQGEIDHDALSLAQAALKMGRSQITVQGRFDTKTEKVSATTSGSLDLGQLRQLLAPKAGDSSGTLAFKAEAWGQARQPLWKIDLNGQDLQSPQLGLHPGSLDLVASGSPAYASIHRVAWRSADGSLEAKGHWRRGEGSHLQVTGQDVSLAPAAVIARTAFLAKAQANLEGDAFVPGEPWALPPLDRIVLNLQVGFTQAGQDAGKAKVALKDGELSADQIELRFPELQFQGSATGVLAKHGLRSITAEGKVNTDAAVVAGVLGAWKIGDGEGPKGKRITTPYQMSGQVEAQAEVRWNPTEGLQLAGDCTVLEPRWHGAQADRVHAEVGIRRNELRIDNIELFKGDGRGWGELWLTWADLPAGVDQIDMCYRAFRLPVEEGLKAADLDPNEIRISGLGSGWTRLYGPYARIRLEGSAQAEAAEVYGLKIPAAKGDFTLDLEGDRLQVKNLRAGDSLATLGQDGDPLLGLLALQGGMDMDLLHRTWQASLQGNVDSEALGVPGPRFQAKVDASLEGPWTKPLGPMDLPRGHVRFSGGRLFLGTQSLEGLEGSLDHTAEGVEARVGMLGKDRPFLTMHGWDTAKGMLGALDVTIGPETADTAQLASRLSGDLIRDLRLLASAEGLWNEKGLAWKGRLNEFVGSFDGFQLFQERPTPMVGDARGVDVDLRLVGQAVGPTAAAGQVASFRASGRVPFDATTPLGLKLQGSAELAKLKPIVNHLMELDSYSLLGDLEPSGAASFDLALGGPYEEPTLDGELRLKQGSLLIRGYPQSVENLGFTIQFHGRDILLPEEEPARGTLAQGRLTFWGKASWGFGGLDSYDLQARLRDFEFRDIPEGFELQGDVDASLKGGDAEGGLIKGTLRANRMLYRADINLRDLILSNSLGSLSGTSGLDPEDPLSRIELDLDLQLAQPWVFETNLLKLQGRPEGAFKVQGTLAQPGLKGRMVFLPGGRITNLLPAGDIVLERGSIDFLDPRSRNPLLDLQGRIDVSPYLVNLQIRGTLDALEMRPTSTPALRRDEITAILIDPSLAPTIGSTTSASSALSYGLAKTSSGLLTTLALADFQERVRRTFNLDRVNVAWRPGSSGASESTVTLGKTLAFQGWQVPFVFTHKKAGDVTTLSGQFEWRLGNFVLQLGASQSGATGLNPSGEIRHSWSPK
ncbi:MAG: translocation/assembly module TamB domain-containing protein [Holophaga sp.]|nr:translocation/assembly module TamB domain-containing protein [Holophaga sp.]